MDFKERWFRKSSKGLLVFFKEIGFPAEFLTIFRIIYGLIVVFAISQGNYKITISFLFIYQLILITDYIDGALARAQGRFSSKWQSLDRFSHRILNALFLISVAISIDNTFLIILTLTISLLFLSVSRISESILFPKGKNYGGKAGKGFGDILGIFIIESPFSVFFFLMLFNLNLIVCWIYSTVYLFGFFYKLRNIFKYREKITKRG
jgi:phosphatidylglycerophosphate synthase